MNLNNLTNGFGPINAFGTLDFKERCFEISFSLEWHLLPIQRKQCFQQNLKIVTHRPILLSLTVLVRLKNDWQDLINIELFGYKKVWNKHLRILLFRSVKCQGKQKYLKEQQIVADRRLEGNKRNQTPSSDLLTRQLIEKRALKRCHIELMMRTLSRRITRIVLRH